MEALKNIYLRALEGVGEMPSWKKDWRWVTLYSICIYAIVLAFRMSFAGRWDHPELWVNGERILATHDAYFWLAKAKGIGGLTGYPLAKAAKVLSDLGIGFGTIAFWTPAVMGALIGIVCFLWCWMLAGRDAGIIAGIIGSLTPGFFFRSRLGYFDTDMFTLLMPMFVAWLLAYWASKNVSSRWLGHKGAIAEVDEDGEASNVWLAFVFGLVTHGCVVWHTDIVNVCVVYFFFTVVFVLVKGRPGTKVAAFYQLCVFLLAAFPGTAHAELTLFPSIFKSVDSVLSISLATFSGIVGIVSSFCLALGLQFARKRRIGIIESPVVCALFFLLLIYVTNLALIPFPAIVSKLAGYFKSETGNVLNASSAPLGPIYPSIVKSIIEAKRVALTVILERGLFSLWLGSLALVVSVFVVAIRPVAVYLLPLVILHLASVKLGVRFSMFGGAALSVFLGVGIYWVSNILLRFVSLKRIVAFGVQCVVAACVLFYCYTAYSKIPLTPVVTKQHAEALVELGERAELDAMIWTWWDWGYASQYYANRETVIDGGKHAGRDVFPVAYVMTTPSPAMARSMVAFSSQYSYGRKYGWVGLYPAEVWDTIPREMILTALDKQLSYEEYESTSTQYFVVTWKDLTLTKWITYYGNWNLESGTTREAAVSNFDPGELGFNIQQGAVMNRKGGGGLVSDITILDSGSAETTEYYMNKLSPRLLPKKRHLVINKVSRQSVLMDRIAYRSMMTRLLIGDPNDPEITPYFKLVVDKLPFARIYEVVQ